MTLRRGGSRLSAEPRVGSQKSVATLVDELRDLVVGYARQETLDPLSSLARGLAGALAGAVLGALGVAMLAVAVLRALQTETGGRFDEGWSWAPYVIVSGGLVVLLAGLFGLLVRKGRR